MCKYMIFCILLLLIIILADLLLKSYEHFDKYVRKIIVAINKTHHALHSVDAISHVKHVRSQRSSFVLIRLSFIFQSYDLQCCL